jgi:hypothetical protein
MLESVQEQTEQTATMATFDVVHQALAAQQSRLANRKQQRGKVVEEKRTRERQDYQCMQLIAEYDCETLPAQAEFRPVLCHDLSSHGFSFWSPQKPNSIDLIVALGNVPFVFMHARIVNTLQDENSSYRGWRVGCEFLARVGT